MLNEKRQCCASPKAHHLVSACGRPRIASVRVWCALRLLRKFLGDNWVLPIRRRSASYAVRVHDLRLYHEVCRNVIRRWTYPLVPDNATSGGIQGHYTYERGCNYKASEVNLHRSVRWVTLTVGCYLDIAA